MTEKLQETLNKYTLYLLSEQRGSSATKAGEVYENVSRHAIGWFLNHSEVMPIDLFTEIRNHIELIGGVLSVDDSVEDKHFSVIGKAHYVDKFWSGRHKCVVVGIDLLTLFYTDTHGIHLPVNYRIIDKTQNKTKNDYFQDMLEEVLNWGIKPRVVSADSWFASEDNMKSLMRRGIGFLFALKSNRLASDETKSYKQVCEYTLPNEGYILHLRNVGFVRVFEKNTFYYAYHNGSTDDKRNKDALETVTRADFEAIHMKHWHIEEYHRALKQLCNTERHFFRNKSTIHSYIHCSLRAFCILEISRVRGILKNWYSFATEAMVNSVRSILGKTHIQDMGLVLK